jgi:hypothetical protein
LESNLNLGRREQRGRTRAPDELGHRIDTMALQDVALERVDEVPVVLLAHKLQSQERKEGGDERKGEFKR